MVKATFLRNWFLQSNSFSWQYDYLFKNLSPLKVNHIFQTFGAK